MSFILLGILNSQVSGAGGGSYELIESNILTSSASSVTFSSIPQDYKHLQIRATLRDNYASWTNQLRMRINNVSTSSYFSHWLRGTGSSVQSQNDGPLPFMIIDSAGLAGNTAGTDVYSSLVIDILDYTSANKNTTVRSFAGLVTASGSRVTLQSGLFNNTAAVTQFQLFPANSTSFVAGSRFSLYGIRG